MPEFNITIVICGFVGGILPDLLRFIRNRFSLNTAKYLTSLKYWLSLLILALLGAFVAWIFNAENITAALAYGFTAPEIISRLASEKQPQITLKGEGSFKLRTWWGS